MGKIAAVILAAGGSSRFGKTKQILPWGSANVINASIRAALLAEFDPIVVVLGADAERIRSTIEISAIQVVINEDWRTGQSSSLRAGIESLPADIDGAIFLLADQPQINVHLLDEIVKYANLGNEVVAPLIDGRRANPVYFSQANFDALKQVSGDQGGRGLMRDMNVKYVEWLDEMQGRDIDLPDDYNKLYNFYHHGR